MATGGHVARVFNPDSAGKERNRLTREIVLALRELMRQTETNELSRNLTAFIALSLVEVHKTVDISVAAWEKRGYWVKSDRFRMEWEWSLGMGEKIRDALINEDWATIAMTAAQVAQKLMKIKVPARNRLGTPWVGAWERLWQGVKK
jgi:hypothetical protein